MSRRKKLVTCIKKERGIALIFTLGILGMLMMIALGFASTAITDRKAASNNSNLTVSRLLAESSANKIISLLQYYDSGINYSHCDSTMDSNYGTYDYIWKLQTSGVFTWDDSYASSGNMNWQYMKVKDPLLGVDKIIGRVAYVVIPGFGLDPATVVKSSVDEGVVTEERPGVDVNEINLRNIDSALITPAIATTMSYTDAGGKLSSTNPTWRDFATLFSALSAAGASLTPQNKADFMNYFVVNSKSENECFWVDLNQDAVINSKDVPSTPGKIGSSAYELAHRFNLARTDWDSLSVSDIVDSPSEWTSSPSTADGKGLLWLSLWQERGTSSDTDDKVSAATRAKQIAANLLNYCQSSSKPVVSDVSPANWDTTTTAPTYTGNKKTPYINEIDFKFDANATVTPKDYDSNGTADHWAYTYNFTLAASVESIDMYGGLVSPELSSLEGKITYDLGGMSGVVTRERTITISGPLTLSTAGSESGYCYTTTFVDTSAWTETTPDQVLDKGYSVTNVKFRLTKVVLQYNGEKCDYSAPDGSTFWSTSIDAIANTGNSPSANSVYCTYQANDPRQNLNDKDWASPGVAISDNRTLGVKNSAAYLTLAANGNDSGSLPIDYEPVGVAPTTVSTAYIRNGTMQSPWELGFIHRASAWQTLNIKEYNKAVGVLAKGGNAYSDSTSSGNGGDANILDQVKMNSNVQNPMKFSLKIQKDNLLKALFTGVQYGSSPNGIAWNPAINGVMLTPAKILNIVTKIKQLNYNFPSRASLATVSDISNDPAFTNERIKKEVIGKVINLCGVANTEYYTIIVVAQAIKDAGGAGTGITIYKDLDGNGIIGSASLPTKGPSTSENFQEKIDNCKLGQYDFGADEILAEQKVLVEVYKNSITGKVDVLSYEYIDGN